MSDAAVSIRGLRHTFPGTRPVEVLDGTDLEAAPGAFVSLVGPSGCGKSTLLQVLAGLLTPDAGEALIEGRSTLGAPGLAAYMPQKDLLLPWRKVIGNAVLGAEIAGTPRGGGTGTGAFAARTLRVVGLRGELALAAQRGDAAAAGAAPHLPRAPARAPPGRTLRGARRDHASGDAPVAAGGVGERRAHGPLRHARRGGGAHPLG